MSGVTASAPSAWRITRRNISQAGRICRGAGQAHGVTTSAHTVISHDPTTDLDDALLKASKELNVDLVVMASHLPNLTDYIWPSNGGKVAAHAKASVMVVRG